MTKGVRCIVFNNNKILLVKREDSGLWELPGGKIEKGEDMFTAAIRELKEETNLQALEMWYLGKWINKIPLLGGQEVLVCIKATGKLSSSWESPEVKYWSNKEIETRLPKHLKKLIYGVKDAHHFTSLTDYDISTIIRFLFGRIKRLLRGHLTVGS